MADKNLPDKVDELLTEVVNKDPLVLASLSAVPYFGGTIATFFSAKYLELYQERTAELFRQFAEHLNSVDEKAIRRDYFDTPEGMDLLIRAVDESSKTRSDDKRNMIARILAGAATVKREGYSPEDYLHLLSDLTTNELMVASFIYTRKPGAGELKDWYFLVKVVEVKLKIDRDDLFMVLARLEAHGLIQIVAKSTEISGSGGSRYARERTGLDRIEYILITPHFKKVMNFLNPNT